MKKVVPNGSQIKKLRLQLDRLSTQKEMANEIGVSIRMLRKIENENSPVAISNFNRLAKALGVDRESIVNGPKAPNPLAITPSARPWSIYEELHVPRHDYDYDYAEATSDEGCLFFEATHAHDMVCIIEASLNEETGKYVQELVNIIEALTWKARDILIDITPSEEITLRLRIRKLLVLLKGNDVWTYQTSVLRKLPERYTVAPRNEPHYFENRLVIAFGPPGEYGEKKMRVPIDNGQPWIIPAGLPDFTKTAPSNAD